MRNRCTTPLSKAKVRQSWSKYNLYNLSRITTPSYKIKTFFQQKWIAKSMLRSYHGEQVREGQWEKMFRRRLKSVVPMDPRYLAGSDGSLESAGRGSGLEKERPQRRPEPTPYMQMTFAPLERRLDTAIFRALFASSARQARQFVVHGAVKVNGKKMKYPGYLLNPGDMFQVDPERVLFATGAPKAPVEAKEADEEAEDPSENTEAEKQDDLEADEGIDIDIDRDPRDILKDLLVQAKSVLASPRDKLGAKKKQDLRAFSQSVKRMLSRSSTSTTVTDSLEAQFLELQNQLKIQRVGQKSLPSDQKASTEHTGDKTMPAVGAVQHADNPTNDPVGESETDNQITDGEYNELLLALTEMQENPVDDSKPYATPWMPRSYMSAFAFIPRYLEVNQNICAAVYLRHPVARPGLAEVPTPFNEYSGSGAFAWYLRRR